jgi:hypothetical protein
VYVDTALDCPITAEEEAKVATFPLGLGTVPLFAGSRVLLQRQLVGANGGLDCPEGWLDTGLPCVL